MNKRARRGARRAGGRRTDPIAGARDQLAAALHALLRADRDLKRARAALEEAGIADVADTLRAAEIALSSAVDRRVRGARHHLAGRGMQARVAELEVMDASPAYRSEVTDRG